jgi:hypothetical protein
MPARGGDLPRRRRSIPSAPILPRKGRGVVRSRVPGLDRHGILITHERGGSDTSRAHFLRTTSKRAISGWEPGARAVSRQPNPPCTTPKRRPPGGSGDPPGGTWSRQEEKSCRGLRSVPFASDPPPECRSSRCGSRRTDVRVAEATDRIAHVRDAGRSFRPVVARTTRAGHSGHPSYGAGRLDDRVVGGDCRRKVLITPPDISVRCHVHAESGDAEALISSAQLSQLTRDPGATGFPTVTTTTSRSSGPGLPSASGAGSALRSLAARIMP